MENIQRTLILKLCKIEKGILFAFGIDLSK